jgi:hypothetical protein
MVRVVTPLARRQLAAVAETTAAAARLAVDVWLRGGWAVDFFLGEVTREHTDVDWFAWAADGPRLAAALRQRGWALAPEPPPHDQQLDLTRDDVELSIALLARDATGRVVVAGGPWAGQPWPDGLLDPAVGRIGPVTCPVVGPRAQIEIKRMMPVWVPGRPRRPKDAEDVARLTAALPPRPGRPAPTGDGAPTVGPGT